MEAHETWFTAVAMLDRDYNVNTYALEFDDTMNAAHTPEPVNCDGTCSVESLGLDSLTLPTRPSNTAPLHAQVYAIEQELAYAHKEIDTLKECIADREEYITRLQDYITDWQDRYYKELNKSIWQRICEYVFLP